MVPLTNNLKHAAACRSEPKFSWGPLVLAAECWEVHETLRNVIVEGEIPGVTANASLKLRTGWALNRCFDLPFGTAAVLAQGGRVVEHLIDHGPRVRPNECHVLQPTESA